MLRIICFLFLISVRSLAQEVLTNSDFKAYEDTINSYSKELYDKTTSDNEKDSIAKLIHNTLHRALLHPSSGNYNFDSLRTISKVSSDDKTFRIFTWHIPLTDAPIKYFGILQIQNKEKKQLISLTDNTSKIKGIENTVLDPNNWYGALYYRIITTQHKKKKYYTLLGWKGNDRLTTKKVIDNIYLEKEKVKFGQAIFKYPKKTAKRVVFEYSTEVTMSVNYNPEEKVIIMDHLSPTTSSLKGQHQYYAPDMSYDGFYWKKGIWEFMEDIDARNPNRPKDKIYNVPEKR